MEDVKLTEIDKCLKMLREKRKKLVNELASNYQSITTLNGYKINGYEYVDENFQPVRVE